MLKFIFLFLATLSMALGCSVSEKAYRPNSNVGKEDVQSLQEEAALLKTRDTQRQRYTVEQKTIHDFSCEKKVDYSSYFEPYLFCVEVDALHDKFFIISESGKLTFNQDEIEEIKRRVLFMDDFEIDMDRDYFPHSDLKNSFHPHKFGFPEYKNVSYSPFSSVNSADTHIYGFINRPKNVRLIAGTNFLEDGPYGKQTNPQAIFIDYEFGPMRNGSLEERNNARFTLLNNEFKKAKAEAGSSRDARRVFYTTEACRMAGKTKEEATVLDICCGSGSTLNLLRVEGYKKLYGIDMDSGKIGVLQKVCQENAIREISSAVINLNSENVADKIRQELQQDVFDVIVLHDAIEHVPDPCKTLHMIRLLLANDGVVLFTGIPDEHSLAAQFEMSAYGDFDKFTHLNFFTKESIEAFANQQSFDVMFLHDSNASVNLTWSFIYEECLPYVRNEKWFVLGREIPSGITIRDVFPDNALVYNLYSGRPQDGKRVTANFERYKLYKKHKEHINLLFKKFFIETTRKIVSPEVLKAKLDDLKENLFTTLVLDRPNGISDNDKEQLVCIQDSEATRVKEAFQDAYHMALRTRWCFFVKRPEPSVG